MELRHLRYFVAVAEEAHLGRAAQRLRVASSALSRQIQDLEREIGVPLLERTSRGLRVAPAGRVFLEYARRALSEVETGTKQAREAVFGGTVLRLAPPDWNTAVRRVALAIDSLRQRAPGSLVDLDATPWPLHPAALAERRIDVGFGIGVGAGDFAPLDATWLADESSSYALLPAAHPLSSREELSLAELRDLALLVPGRDVNPVLHDHMVGTARAGGVEPRLAMAPASFAACAQFIAAGAGWTLVTESTMQEPPTGTVVRRIVGVHKALGMFVLCRAGDDRPIVREFLRCVASAFSDATAGQEGETAGRAARRDGE